MLIGKISVSDDYLSSLQLLMMAKRAQLAEKKQNPSDEDVKKSLTKKELQLHCRRETRGAEETKRMFKELLTSFDSPAGRDSLGAPLLKSDKIWQIWESQLRHMECIQDPEGYSLYTKTGSRIKGGVEVPMYRCVRGSNSLESFHLHLARFIPGEGLLNYYNILFTSLWELLQYDLLIPNNLLLFYFRCRE